MTNTDLTQSGLILGNDQRWRPAWATTSDLLRDYYDYEWGRPVTSENEMFERIVLEGFQAGLSWEIILKKRPTFREAFANFDVDTVAAFTQDDIARLLENPAIIRNANKIRAAVNNAQRVQELRSEGGIVAFLQQFAPADFPRPAHLDQVPTKSDESLAMARALKKRGFTFVGPKTCFALMEATGLVNTRICGAGELLSWPPEKELGSES